EAELILEAVHKRGRGSEHLDVAQFEQADCSRQMFGRRLRLAFGARLVAVPVSRNDQLGIRRESILRPDCTLLAEKAAIVMVAGVADRGVIGGIRLDEDLRRGTAATG